MSPPQLLGTPQPSKIARLAVDSGRKILSSVVKSSPISTKIPTPSLAKSTTDKLTSSSSKVSSSAKVFGRLPQASSSNLLTSKPPITPRTPQPAKVVASSLICKKVVSASAKTLTNRTTKKSPVSFNYTPKRIGSKQQSVVRSKLPLPPWRPCGPVRSVPTTPSCYGKKPTVKQINASAPTSLKKCRRGNVGPREEVSKCSSMENLAVECNAKTEIGFFLLCIFLL